MGALPVVDKSQTGSKRTHDGVTVLLELCMRFEQMDSVDSGRDRIALRDLPGCPEYVAPAPAVTFTVRAPMTEYPAPPDEAEPLDIDAVMAERSRVRRGVASGELDPEAMHASNRSLERALSRLAPQAHLALGGPTPSGSGGGGVGPAQLAPGGLGSSA